MFAAICRCKQITKISTGAYRPLSYPRLVWQAESLVSVVCPLKHLVTYFTRFATSSQHRLLVVDFALEWGLISSPCIAFPCCCTEVSCYSCRDARCVDHCS